MVILFSKYAIFKEILNFKIVMINKVTIWIFSLSVYHVIRTLHLKLGIKKQKQNK